MLRLLRADPRPHSACHRKTLSSSVLHMHCLSPLSGWYSIHGRCRQPHPLHWWLSQVMSIIIVYLSTVTHKYYYYDTVGNSHRVAPFATIPSCQNPARRRPFVLSPSIGAFTFSVINARYDCNCLFLAKQHVVRVVVTNCYSWLGLWVGAVVGSRRARLLPAGRTRPV